jgi:hypothetical protein
MVGTSRQEDYNNMRDDGYSLLGYSGFNTTRASNRQALDQAAKVGADVVIVYKTYTDSLSGSIPMTLPDTQTSSTYISGSGYSSRGSPVSFSGTAFTTQYGTKTTYIPYRERYYDYYASYWTKTSEADARQTEKSISISKNNPYSNPFTGPRENPYVNPYSKTFEEETDDTFAVVLALFVVPNPASNPIIQEGCSMEADNKMMRGKGYFPLGKSAFKASAVDGIHASNHARIIGADVVMIYKEYADSITTPIKGLDGVSFNTISYNHTACFWKKAKPIGSISGGKHKGYESILGARLVDVNSGKVFDEIGGCIAMTDIVKGSPAFSANIKDGYILKKVNGIEVETAYQSCELLSQANGQSVAIEYFGSELVKTNILLNQQINEISQAEPDPFVALGAAPHEEPADPFAALGFEPDK